MRKFFKVTSLLTAMAVVVGMLAAGCGKTDSGKGSASTASAVSESTKAAESTAKLTDTGLDISKEVTLKFVNITGPVPDEDVVLEEINKKLLSDLNCKLSVDFIDWSGWDQKYKLILSSGEPVDMIFAGTWTFLNDLSRKGAFHDITDLVPKYAPKTVANFPKDTWDLSKIGGKIFTIPNANNPAYARSGIIYREDLRKKYGVPEINKFEDFEAYFDAIKANEKKMVPLKINTNEDWYLWQNYSFQNMGKTGAGLDNTNLYCGLEEAKPNLVEIAQSPLYESFAQLMKKWADKGFWPKSTLAEKTSSREYLKNGMSAAAAGNLYDYTSDIKALGPTHPDWEIKFYYSKYNGKVEKNSILGNGIAFPTSGENVERALAVYDLLANDSAYYTLAAYGIKDKHYKVNADGSFTSTQADVDWTKRTYPEGAMFMMGMWNKKLNPPDPAPTNDSEKKFYAIWDEEKKYEETGTAASALVNFFPDTESVKNEIAACTEVNNTYFHILNLGFSKDPAKTLQEYREKLKAAGQDKITSTIKQQVEQYLSAK